MAPIYGISCSAPTLLSSNNVKPSPSPPTPLSPQCWNPCPIPPRRSKFPSQINLANVHQSRQLRFLARPHLRQRVQVLPCLHQNSSSPHQVDTRRGPLHQGHKFNCTNSTTSVCSQNQGTPCPDRTHKQALHRRHGPFSRPLLQRQLLHHTRLPSRLQRHTVRTLPVPSQSPLPYRIKLHHFPPPEEQAQRRPADSRQQMQHRIQTPNWRRMKGNLSTSSPPHAPPQCSRTRDPDLQGLFSIYTCLSIQLIPQLPMGQTPPANRSYSKPPLSIQHCPCHLHVGALLRPLQL